MVQLAFDATQVAPSTGSADVLEAGEYGVQIIGTEMKETKKKDGHLLEITMSCIDEGFAGKRIQARLNVNNPSTQAVEIAMSELSAICHVTGVMSIQDTQQLHGVPFRVRVDKEPRNDKPDLFSNVIRGYMDMNGVAPAAGAAAGAAAPGAPGAPAAPAAQQQPPAPVQQQQAAPAAEQQQAPVQQAAPPVQQQAQAETPPAAAPTPPWQK